MRAFWLLFYYAVLQKLPMHPFPGGALFNRMRLFAVKRILSQCGKDVMVKDRCYFGDGRRLTIGDRSQLGQNARLNGTIHIGKDVLMGQDVVMMATSHRYDQLDIPIIAQGETEEQPIRIGDGCWIGTRVIVLPGVEIGHDSIVAAGAVVTKSCPPWSILGGIPARVVKMRKTDETASSKEAGSTDAV